MEAKNETSKEKEGKTTKYNIFYLAENKNEDQAKKSTQNNLSNTDFNNKSNRIQSPRSKIVLQLLGLEENKLYKLSKRVFGSTPRNKKSQRRISG